MKIHKNDTIVVIKGKDRGKKGKVLRAFPRLGKIMVDGVNTKKRHRKPRRSSEKGQIITIIAPISVANVKFVCIKCNKGVRIRIKGSGRDKFRVCATCGEKLG